MPLAWCAVKVSCWGIGWPRCAMASAVPSTRAKKRREPVRIIKPPKRKYTSSPKGLARRRDHATFQYAANLPHNRFSGFSVTLALEAAARNVRGAEPSDLIQSSSFFPEACNSGTLIGLFPTAGPCWRSEENPPELQSLRHLV